MASVVRWPECQNCKDQSAKRRSSPHWRGRTPAKPAGRVGLARGPRRASRSAHASGQPWELRSPRPRASPAKITLLKGATASRSPRAHRREPKAGGALGWDRLSRRGPRSGWSRIPPPAVPGGRGRATLSPRHPEEPAHSSPNPHLFRIPRDSAPALRETGQRRTVEQRSGDPAWSNRTRTREREWGPVEKRRRERELQKIPKPASLPPAGPSRHRFLPEISFPAAARGKIRAAHAAP